MQREALQKDLRDLSAELSALKNIGSTSGGVDQPQNVRSLVQRLVQKEKQVLQLQTELERFKVQNPETRDAVSSLIFTVDQWLIDL